MKDLNRISNENITNIDKLLITSNKLVSISESNVMSIGNHEKEISDLTDLVNELKKFSEFKEIISDLKEKIRTKFKRRKQKQMENMKILSIKFDEIDENFATLFSANSNNLKATKKINVNILTEQFIKRSNAETTVTVESLRLKLDLLDSSYLNFKEEISKRVDDEREEYHKIIKNMKSIQDENENTNSIMITETLKKNEERFDKLTSMLNETQANEKLLLDCLINKIDVDDLQKLQKILLIEIEKNSSRINNISKLDKPTTIIKLMPDKIICDYHKKNNLTNENDIMRKVDDLLNLNTKEMEKLWESFAEIKEKVLEFEKLRIKEGLFKISSLEDGLKILQTKRKSPFLQDLHSDENSIPINSNDNEDKYLLNFINNLKKENNEKVKIINQRVDLISNKQDNISNEILGKLKKDLVNESSRILEEFKTNLRNSMGKIEDQLHDKVDRLNLDEIARKIDTKIAYEVSKKLDKTDLKKNNGIINKKVLKSLN